ncbi:MAG: hypothetical protein KDA51_14640, partial [Planctomycetales bacterium]|nr:hypothetical protein [Planctomycetales bacterium]
MVSNLIPPRAVFGLASLYVVALIAWLLLFGAVNNPSWPIFLLSAVVAGAFMSFGVALMGCLRFFG